ncbi:MAG TPA: T9SS type A sorting domain-containing protein, partial [Candidatus Acidoferrum sp.]|nr:T9SS type A sorting domain-containing protein [Candidatus Acidoferrum sp.]
GRIAYFGSFVGMSTQFSSNTKPRMYAGRHEFTRRFFGIDSSFIAGIGMYALNGGVPTSDTLLGFDHAEAIVPSTPGLYFDRSRNPFTSRLTTVWPSDAPPIVSSFVANARGEVTHIFKSQHPGSSLEEGRPVGVRTVTNGTETYLYGFHLWYLHPDEARGLVDYLLAQTPTDITDNPTPTLPERLTVHQNYPNPFNAATRIIFELPRGGRVTLEIFNMLGQRVGVPVDDSRPAGRYSVIWNGTDGRGVSLASGVYLYRLRYDNVAISRKMILLK